MSRNSPNRLEAATQDPLSWFRSTDRNRREVCGLAVKIPFMTRFWPAALAAVTLVAVGSCSSAVSAPQGRAVGSPGTTAAASPAVTETTPAIAPRKIALAIPRKRAGELARTTFVKDKGVSAKRSTTRDAPIKGSMLLSAQCSASGPGATLTYVVLDARARTNGGGRTLSSATVDCGYGIRENGAYPLVQGRLFLEKSDKRKMIQIQFRRMSPLVTRAYVVIVPG
jgi:hypothetical protein